MHLFAVSLGVFLRGTAESYQEIHTIFHTGYGTPSFCMLNIGCFEPASTADMWHPMIVIFLIFATFQRFRKDQIMQKFYMSLDYTTRENFKVECEKGVNSMTSQLAGFDFLALEFTRKFYVLIT